jgi:outer membrane lipoprotein-sorting protein
MKAKTVNRWANDMWKLLGAAAVGPCHHHRSARALGCSNGHLLAAWRNTFSIPKGLCPPAQGCDPRATLGKQTRQDSNPERVVAMDGSAVSPTRGRNPFRVGPPVQLYTQGSLALLRQKHCGGKATLGFAAESLWDSSAQEDSKDPGRVQGGWAHSAAAWLILPIRIAIFLLLVAATVTHARAQLNRVSELPSAEGEKQARKLIAETFAQRPEENTTNTGGILRIRNSDDQLRSIGVRFETFSGPGKWVSVYHTLPTAEQPSSTLKVIHELGKPAQYSLDVEAGKGSEGEGKVLAGNNTFVPFAGSDFWIADLGLEFLSWPRQRVLRSEMRHSRSCKVLESINPNPSGNAYGKVISWITVEAPHAPVHADAYDAKGKRIKEFDPKSVERVHGSFQLQSIEMRNLRTGSSTVMEFGNAE